MTTQPRIDFPRTAPEPYRALSSITAYLASCGLEHPLLELVKVRASQINGCAFCIDMHTQDARAGGETERRIYALNAWRETPFFTDRERAALAWTEELTTFEDAAPDGLYEQLREHFSEKEIVDLTWAIASINAWNRLALGLRSVPGSYKPRAAQA